LFLFFLFLLLLLFFLFFLVLFLFHRWFACISFLFDRSSSVSFNNIFFNFVFTFWWGLLLFLLLFITSHVNFFQNESFNVRRWSLLIRFLFHLGDGFGLRFFYIVFFIVFFCFGHLWLFLFCSFNLFINFFNFIIFFHLVYFWFIFFFNFFNLRFFSFSLFGFFSSFNRLFNFLNFCIFFLNFLNFCLFFFSFNFNWLSLSYNLSSFWNYFSFFNWFSLLYFLFSLFDFLLLGINQFLSYINLIAYFVIFNLIDWRFNNNVFNFTSHVVFFLLHICCIVNIGYWFLLLFSLLLCLWNVLNDLTYGSWTPSIFINHAFG